MNCDKGATIMKRGIVGVALGLVFATLIFLFFYWNEPEKPNILLISLDTLRADAVGSYSPSYKKRSDTPALDALAEDGVRYQYAYAPIAFTLSSHMSMFTGVYPGVHTVEGTNKNPEQAGVKVLPNSIRTLPQILKENGYSTLGLFSSAWLKAGFGFGRGFNYYQQMPSTLNLASTITGKALSLLDSHQRGQKEPFFLFLHYYDVHSDFWSDHPPYGAPKSFQIPEYNAATKHFCAEQEKCATQFLLDINLQQRELPQEDRDLLKKLYLGGVKYTDSEVGRLIQELKERKLYDNTLIIVTSDHGEEFQEHGALLHEQTYEECTRVPLIIKFPHSQGHGNVSDNLAELIDILPTVLDFLGEPELRQVQGKTLLRKPTGVVLNGTFPLLQDKLKSEIYATRNGTYKIIYNTRSKQALLFNLDADNGETIDISSEKLDVVGYLSKIIEDKIFENISRAKEYSLSTANTKNILGEEEQQRLKSLGYTK